MVTTVKLQDPFEYSWYVTLAAVVLGIVAVSLLIWLVVMLLKFRKLSEMGKPRYRRVVMNPEMLRRMKLEYTARIQALFEGYNRGDITKRDGYQRLSAIIRSFVHEVTGINVENFTVKEVRALGIKKLDILMEEYYVPEFAEEEKAIGKDFAASCNVAMGVIKTWS